MRYTFADCELDTQLYTLRRSGQLLQLRPKVFQVLLYLVENRHRVVPKQEVLAHVWPELFISEATLDNYLKEVRQALGDSGRQQRLIQTLRGHGYRFIAAVETRTEASLDETPAIPAVPTPLPAPAAAQRHPIPGSAAGEHKVVTMLCCGLGETPALPGADGLDTLHSLLRALHAVVQGQVEQYGGIVQQVTSTHLLAVFGAPVAYEDHATRAVLAALNIQQRVQGTSLTTGALTVRLGLHTGLMAVGGLGDAAGATLPLIGDVARLATRLQACAAPGRLLCSAATARLIRDRVRLERAAPVPGGKQTPPVTAYHILGPRPQRLPVVVCGERGLSRFVGRARELAVLQAVLAQAAAGRGQVVGIVGDPGMGKSRLLHEFRQHLRGMPVTYVAGQCLSYGQATPYLPVLDMLRSLCGLTETDADATLVAKVQSAVQAAGMAADAWAPSLLQLLGVDAATPTLVLQPPDALKARTFAALRQVMLHQSQQQPLVMAIDNLHWSDPTSEEYLASLVDHLAGAPLLLLVTYRPGYRPPWLAKSYATQLALPPLEAQDSQTVLQGILRSHPVSDTLLQTILRTAEGNPFFLEELAWTVVEQGAAAPTLAVPETVQAVLMARIDRLLPEDKRLLQVAAVIGTTVPVPLLQASAEVPAEVLYASLTRLQAAEFLYERRHFPVHEYTFKHALTHEVAYAGLLQERRRWLHARIVEAIDGLDADPLSDHVARLAHHALRGELWDQALAYCRQAGDNALAHAAHREAVTYFEQALRALAQLPGQRATRTHAIDLRLALRTALMPSGDFARILAVLREAEALATTLGDPQRLVQVAGFLSRHFSCLGAHEQAIAVAQRVLALATATGEDILHALANFYLGNAYQAYSDYRRAIDCYQQTVAAFDGARRHERFGLVFLPAVDARADLAAGHAELGLFAAGRAFGDEGLQIAEAVDHPASLMVAYYGIGVLALRQGDLPRALPALEQAVGICQDAPLPAWVPWMAATLGAAYTLAGRVAEAIPLLTQVMEQIVATGMVIGQTRWRLALGEAQLLAGRLDEAQALAEQALTLARAHQERGHEAYARHLLGAIAARHNPPERARAEAHSRQALALADELDMRPLQAHCHRGLGTLYAATGQREPARTELSTAIEMYQVMEMMFWLPETEAALAQVEGQ